jgi:hypothetical protein
MPYTLVPPPSSSSAIIISETPPANPQQGLKWFNTLRGTEFMFFDGFWIQDSSASAPPAPTTDRTMPCRTVEIPTMALMASDAGGVVRFTNSALNDTTKILTIPMTGEGFAPQLYSVFTVRNSGEGALQVVGANLSVVLVCDPLANILPRNTTAQWYYLGENTWELF